MRYTPFLAVTILFLAPAIATAQGTLQVHSVDHRVQAEGTVIIQAQGNNLAMAATPDNGSTVDAMAMIFRGDSKEMIMMDPTSKSYLIFDGQMLEQLSAQVNDQMKSMSDQISEQMKGLPADLMDKMPPEARAQFDEAMKKIQSGQLSEVMQGEGEPAVEVEAASLTRTSQTGRFAGIRCRWYERVDGPTKQRYCAADADDIDGGAAVARAMRGMTEFYEDLREQFGGGKSGFDESGKAASPFFDTQGLLDENLLPIRTEEYVNEELTEETELRSANAGNVPASAFEPPEDYTAGSMMGGMR
jgi:hypothetical protein